MGCHIVKHIRNKCWYFFYFIITIANTKLSDWWLEIAKSSDNGLEIKRGSPCSKVGCFSRAGERWRQEALWGAWKGAPPHPQHSHGLCNVDITSSARSSPCHFPELPGGSVGPVSQWTHEAGPRLHPSTQHSAPHTVGAVL